MLDDLICAYRARFYDWDFAQINKFCRNKKKLLFIATLYFLGIIIAVVCCISFHSFAWGIAGYIIELVLAICADRFIVKHHQKLILRREGHLEEVVSFLQTILPEKDLFHEQQVAALIERLTKHIDTHAPFNKFVSALKNFAKTIVFPIVAFVAGIFAVNLSEVNPYTIIGWAISIIFVLGLIYLYWIILTQFLRKLVCRDYDAAITLREDLLDIKLLYFTAQSSKKL